ncbi:hypothetical protein Anas_04984 [Armadillidium nasatum]|uniref:Bile acid-CoA:amino acid N-acyltransferase n=1 Tax=Armadillidium nasatum TaxID=96803 RepID=A0A5N5SL21_9CRUS|nr:hypothetical protein Anas_04984 [Armadillidium nasatum]
MIMYTNTVIIADAIIISYQGNILTVSPEKCLQDEKVLVKMQNLSPGSDVTLTSHVDDGLSNIFFTYSHFRANEQGNIDLSKDGSMGGSFRGVFQMGPIGCLKAGPETYKYYRYINQNVPVPMTVKFTVLKGDGPFPGVVDIMGVSGTLFDFRAAQLAARGFVKKPNVAVIGLSKGCDLAFSMATFIPEVKAAICINGLSVNCLKPMRVKDKVIPMAPESDPSKITEPEPGLLSTENAMIDPTAWPECQIPIETADAHFLMISCLDDKAAKTDEEFERVGSILKNHGKDNYEILKYEGGGHLLESPYSPYASASYSRVAKKALHLGRETLISTSKLQKMPGKDRWNL